jgi:hypothetical protein
MGTHTLRDNQHFLAFIFTRIVEMAEPTALRAAWRGVVAGDRQRDIQAHRPGQGRHAGQRYVLIAQLDAADVRLRHPRPLRHVWVSPARNRASRSASPNSMLSSFDVRRACTCSGVRRRGFLAGAVMPSWVIRAHAGRTSRAGR